MFKIAFTSINTSIPSQFGTVYFGYKLWIIPDGTYRSMGHRAVPSLRFHICRYIAASYISQTKQKAGAAAEPAVISMKTILK